MRDKLSNVLPEQRERRIRYYNIRLLQEFNALLAAKVPVAIEMLDADCLWVGHVALSPGSLVFKIDGLFRIIPAEQVTTLILVARSDDLCEAQLLKVVREVVEEVTNPRVVAVAVYCLAFEVLPVMLQFSVDVG